MEDKLNKAKEILKKYNQEHLLQFYDELSEEQKNILINQILNMNFEQILNLYNNSIHPKVQSKIDISPLQNIEKDLL